jgi:hypothetical protein
MGIIVTAYATARLSRKMAMRRRPLQCVQNDIDYEPLEDRIHLGR